MTHQPEPSPDTPGLLTALAISATMLVAGQAIARDVMPAPEPQILSVELETDSLYWDLCVGSEKDAAIARLAEQIAAGIDDPNALYVIQLPQIGVSWDTPGNGALSGLDGDVINRKRLAMYRGGYEVRVERALLQVVSKVQDERPGARLSLQDFYSRPLRNTRSEAYARLEQALPFVSLSDTVDMKSSRSFANWLDDMSMDEGSTVLVQTDDGWVLAGDDTLLEAITEPLDQAYVSAWPEETVLGDTVLSPDTFGLEPDSGSEGEPDTRISVDPNEYIGGNGAVEHGRRTLSEIEMMEFEEYQRKLMANQRQAPSDPEPDEPETNPGGVDNPDPDEPGSPQATETPLLIPGSGFTGPSYVAAVHGNPAAPGGDATAIARWDVVPFQTIEGSFEIGVVAFHFGGIERVDFSLNNGPWQPVYDMTLNERTGVVEYTARVDAATLPDGQFEVRAIAYPKNGEPRLLAGALEPESVKNGEHSLFLSANANQTLASVKVFVSPTGSDSSGDGTLAKPYASIMKAVKVISDRSGGTADGGTVYLTAGDHMWGNYQYSLLTTNSERWLTVEPAPGLSKEDVRISGCSSPRWWDGIRLPLQRLHNLTLMHPLSLSTTSGQAGAWLDDCTFIGAGAGSDGEYATATGYHPVNEAKFSARGVYVTDTLFEDIKRPSIEWTLARNVELDRVGLDAFFNPRMILNCELRNHGVAGDVGHRDVVQYFKGNENTIIYGFKAVDDIIGQPIFSRGFPDDRQMDNAAFVNVIIDHAEWEGVHKAQWQQNSNHVLFWHTTILDNTLLVRDDGNMVTNLKNFSIRNSVLQTFVYSATGQPVEALDIIDNHFIDSTSYGAIMPGTGATTGPARFSNPGQLDYRPAVGSPLLGRVQSLVTPIDLMSHQRNIPASVGTFER